MRTLLRVSLSLAVAGLVVAAVANLGLYANADFLPDEIRGPQPVAGAVGRIFLQAGVLVISCAMALNFFGLPLSFFREPVGRNFFAAFGGLLVSMLAWQVNTYAITRVRANPARRQACEVTKLGTLIERYANKHDGHLPTVGNWCETLTDFDPNAARYLAYPTRESMPPGFSTLALNASVEGKRLREMPGDNVLLFGTRPAQNPVGDHQLLTSDSYGGIGALVLFADLHVEFVRAENFGRLRWGLD